MNIHLLIPQLGPHKATLSGVAVQNMSRPLPGSSFSGGIGSSISLYAASPKPKPTRPRKTPSPRKVTKLAASVPKGVDRGSSPLHIPGVEILVNGAPYVAASAAAQKLDLHEKDLQPSKPAAGAPRSLAAATLHTVAVHLLQLQYGVHALYTALGLLTCVHTSS